MIQNGETFPLKDLPKYTFEKFHCEIEKEIKKGKRLASFFAVPRQEKFLLVAIIADDEERRLFPYTCETEKSFPSLTPTITEAHLFEREIYENYGLLPEGHPWLKPVRKLFSDSTTLLYPFYQIEKEIHEVAVGPVHAGIIEPGHFRFQCSGETIFHLEIALGFQHRGIEKALVKGPNKRSLPYMETIAGDTTVGHTIAYCQILEAFSSSQPPLYSQYIRAIALELERLANHTGDLGAIANDIGFLPTASFCGRLRGDFLNLTAYLCGSRFGRGLIIPGGVAFNCPDITFFLERLNTIYNETCQAVELLWSSTSVMNRLEKTGVISHETAKELGLVGLVARSCGLKRDVRANFPKGLYLHSPMQAIFNFGGDVLARAYLRYLEIKASVSFIQNILKNIPEEKLFIPCETLQPEKIAVSLVEGWRGEICHIAITDEQGRFAYYKIVDPSFHNWMGLALACRNEEIYNFPLCNKSFNLSYCGHDL